MPLKSTPKLGNPLKNSKHALKSPWGNIDALISKKAKKHKKH